MSDDLHMGVCIGFKVALAQYTDLDPDEMDAEELTRLTAEALEAEGYVVARDQ